MLILSKSEQLSRARSDFRAGIPVLFEDRGASLLSVPLETLTDLRLASLRDFGGPFIAITDMRAQTLKIPAYDGPIARIRFSEDRDLDWARAIADPALDLKFPLKGPFDPLRGGETAAANAALRLAKLAHLLPAVAAVELSKEQAQAFSGSLVTLRPDDISTDAILPEFQRISSANVPLVASEAGHVHVFRPDFGGDEHYAIEIGKPSRERPVLARLHSACFTGDVLGSLKCDCGAQLQAALSAMGQAGEGILLYLNQEGRGIGLANKMRAYALQDQGFDTVEANHRLGFRDDERDFRIGAEVLKDLGFSSVRLMTNNPAKVDKMNAHGIVVTERVPLRVGRNDVNDAYLRTKAEKSGHML